jgi:hypothetical protein
MQRRTFFIGTDGEVALDSLKTDGQIRKAKELECLLITDRGERLRWDFFEDAKHPMALFLAIREDRKARMDERRCLESRPNFCVVTAEDGKAVRLEYYEGNESLKLSVDLRSKETTVEELSNFMDQDTVSSMAPCFRNVYIRR